MIHISDGRIIVNWHDREYKRYFRNLIDVLKAWPESKWEWDCLIHNATDLQKLEAYEQASGKILWLNNQESAILLGVTVPTLWLIRKARNWTHEKDGRNVILRAKDVLEEKERRRQALIAKVYEV